VLDNNNKMILIIYITMILSLRQNTLDLLAFIKIKIHCRRNV